MDSCGLLCLGGRRKEKEPSSARQPTPGDSSDHAAATRAFSFEELSAATSNFREGCRVGRGLYKGYLESVNQVVAIKRHVVDRHGSSDQGSREGFLAHAMMLSALRHPNVVKFVGFCADGDHRILVHSFMPLGSLQDHLHGTTRLDWNARMKIAAGVAKGLEYVHGNGVVYRGFRCSDILLGDGHHPKLSAYGLEEPSGRPGDDRGRNAFVTRPTFGVLTPEYIRTGKLSARSDVYSFGVVLLEIITGRRAIDDSRTAGVDRCIDTWARPLLKDRTQFPRMADPAMQGRYPRVGLQESLEVAS